MHIARHVIVALYFMPSLGQAIDSGSCHSDPERQKARSEELQSIVAADQADRQDPNRFFNDPVFGNQVLRRVKLPKLTNLNVGVSNK